MSFVAMHINQKLNLSFFMYTFTNLAKVGKVRVKVDPGVPPSSHTCASSHTSRDFSHVIGNIITGLKSQDEIT